MLRCLLSMTVMVSAAAAQPAPQTHSPEAILEAFLSASAACRAMIGGEGVDLSAPEFRLSPPARLRDTPLAQRRDNGIVDFFGLDARIRLALRTTSGAPVMLLAQADGARCEASAAALADFTTGLSQALVQAGWTAIDAHNLQGPAGESVRVTTTTNPDGATLVRAFFARQAQ